MCVRVGLVFVSFSLSAHFWLSVILKEDLDDDKEVRMLRTFFFVLCDSHCIRYTFVAERERERERRRRSLSFSRTRVCVMRIIFHFVFLPRKMRNLVAKRTQTRTSFWIAFRMKTYFVERNDIVGCHRTRNRVLFASRRRVCASISTRFRESWIFSFLGLKGSLWLRGSCFLLFI